MQQFACGAAGAALWMILAYGVGIAATAARGGIQWRASTQRVCGVLGLILAYLILGAAAPYVLDAHVAKEAVGYGLGWQGVFGHFTRQHLEPAAS